MTATALFTIVVVGGSLSSVVDVVSVPECVDPAAVVVAVDAVGGVETEERIKIVVSAAPAESLAAGQDPFVVDVDIELLAAPPLHRVVPIRAIECKDVADLVAVLLANHRRAHPKPLSAPPPPAPKKREHAPRPSTSTPRPDAPRTTSAFEIGPLDFGGWSPCSGPPSCGEFPLNASIGVGATLPFAGRAQADLGLALTENIALVVALDAIQNKSAGAYAGFAYRAMREKELEISIRGLFGGGGGRRISAFTVDGDPCPPTTPETNNKSNLLEINGFSTQLYASPLVAARVRLRWVYVEAGGFWQLGVDDTPGMFLTFGVALLSS